jgi:hypothetical protein
VFQREPDVHIARLSIGPRRIRACQQGHGSGLAIGARPSHGGSANDRDAAQQFAAVLGRQADAGRKPQVPRAAAVVHGLHAVMGQMKNARTRR